MIYRSVEKTELLLSIIGYGGWGAGIKGWRDVDEKKVRESIEEALKWGINLFDTSPIYGNGKSESILGEALAGFRKYIVLSTKFGLVENSPGKITHDISRDSMLREFEMSLKRLKTDYIDIYNIHYPDGKTELEAVYKELQQLKKNGAVKYIGVSNYDFDQVKNALINEVSVVQNKYNYIDNEDIKSIIPYCKGKGAGYIAYSTFAQGLLTDKIGADFVPGKKDVRRLNPVFSDRNRFNGALEKKMQLGDDVLYNSLKFVITTPGVTSALITMTRPEHVKMNVKIAQMIASDM